MIAYNRDEFQRTRQYTIDLLQHSGALSLDQVHVYWLVETQHHCRCRLLVPLEPLDCWPQHFPLLFRFTSSSWAVARRQFPGINPQGRLCRMIRLEESARAQVLHELINILPVSFEETLGQPAMDWVYDN